MLDISLHSKTIALELLGEPNKQLSNQNELRFGNKGSLSIDLSKGTFYDHENDTGGGMVALIEQERPGANIPDFLRSIGVSDSKMPPVKSNASKIKAKVYTDQEMKRLAKDCELYSRYTDSFCVMRFEGKNYRPFTKTDEGWTMKRPKGLLPLLVSDGDPILPLLIVEGEKAYQAVVDHKMYSGIVCCFHGGVSQFDKSDWSVVEQKEAIIFPDNDEPGLKMAQGLKSLLDSLHISTTIATPPSNWVEKDDLADHTDWKVDLIEYTKEHPYVPDKPPVDPRRFRLVHAADAMENIEPPDFVIKSIVEADSLCLLYGSAKAGKSFVSISMAASVSMGLDWYNHKTKEGLVVYLAGEGQRGIARRLLAWQQLHGFNIKKSKFHFSNRGAQLLDDDESLLLRDEILTLQDHYNEPPKMIVIDTLARNFGAGNENSTEDMNRFVASIDRYLREEFGSAIVLVHHTGHDAASRARGSSVLPAAVDWSYQVSREDDEDVTMYLNFEQTLIKDGRPLPSMRFQFQEVELFEMVDEDGMPTTSGALKEVPFITKQKAKKLGKNQKIVKEAIENIHLRKQNEARSKGLETHNIYVSNEDLVDYFKGKLPSDSRIKAIDGLIKNEQIGGNDEIGYMPADATPF
jgi:5S rRNA maturation endonuclease (ribonuclease M5)